MAADNRPDDGADLTKLFLPILERVSEVDRWAMRTERFWCYVQPPGHCPRLQGWKLHVSATLTSAPAVLRQATEVLLSHRAAFKFAKGLEQVAQLNSTRYQRGGSGKVITVYPDDDDHFRLLAEELHKATHGLAGPAILSDRRYRPDSLVHYRYGGFTDQLTRLDIDGSYVPMVVAPDGTWIEDRREPWFSAPSWAPHPLPHATAPVDPPRPRGNPVLIGGRFLVAEAIRHSNRGGVYRALDQDTGKRTILKEARPNVATTVEGDDAQTMLRAEAQMLDELAPLGLVPRNVAFFEHGGHAFLAEEEIPGTSLRHFVQERCRLDSSRRPAPSEVVATARKLVDLLIAVHNEGLVLRDLNPGNIIVTPDGDLRLVDLEFAARPGEPVIAVRTAGYTAPEQLAAERYGPAPERTADLYSLGATILYVSTGMTPVLAADDPPVRRLGDRLASLVRLAARDNPTLGRLSPLVVGLTADDPDSRWSLDRAAVFLRFPGTSEGVRQSGKPERLDPDVQENFLRDILAYTVEQMASDDQAPWPAATADTRTGDHCNVHAGAGGTIAVLSRAVQVYGDAKLRHGLAVAARWLDAALWREPRVLPGLFFGRSGAAWALYDAARTLEDDELTGSAIAYAKRIPLRWPNPDVTHGTAGAGIAQLALWRATGDNEFRDRAQYCAQSVLQARVSDGDGWLWPIPEDFPSQLAGTVHYGFAHGTAGIATFLLAAGTALDNRELVDVALGCGKLLCANADRLQDLAVWPVGPPGIGKGSHQELRTSWWCSGSGGVGAFLVRLWQATGDRRFLEVAELAATAARRDRWFLSPIHCHGNAGNGELLLDLAAAAPRPDPYLTGAAEIAACIHSRAVRRSGRMVVPNEFMQEMTFSYGLGLAGVAGFLLRLCHGGPRWFMPDDQARLAFGQQTRRT
ncbi:class IV lanthionine synthetase LanL [Fodinicola acaciae]|uniref:class IV lanthionine synthetase LanL n=1 Tax=Fodinicola acaciae TaxID=2681555 RepID=UPI0013D860C6|nr:class IV lanthionine synthetase LanL [Fodinicola acaciae]